MNEIDGVNENAELLSAQINETVEKQVQLVKDEGQKLIDQVDDGRWKKLKCLEKQANGLKTTIGACRLAEKRADELFESDDELLKVSPWLFAILKETMDLSGADNQPVTADRRAFQPKTKGMKRSYNLV